MFSNIYFYMGVAALILLNGIANSLERIAKAHEDAGKLAALTHSRN